MAAPAASRGVCAFIFIQALLQCGSLSAGATEASSATGVQGRRGSEGGAAWTSELALCGPTGCQSTDGIQTGGLDAWNQPESEAGATGTSDVCSLAPVNPCGAGTCVSAPAGAYHCICFLGYRPAVNADGTPTCSAPVEGENTIPPVTYNTKPGDSCSLVAAAFGLTLRRLVAQNTDKAWQSLCLPLKPSVSLNVANPLGQSCQVLYSAQQGDSCGAIEQRFGLLPGSLSATLNPGLACGTASADGLTAGLHPGQQVCVKLGQPTSEICTEVHTVSAEEAASKSCAALYANRTIDALAFHELNQGINCNNLYVGQEVCVGGLLTACANSYYLWQSGNTCTTVLRLFCASPMTWSQCFTQNPTCPSAPVAGSTRICVRRCTGATGTTVSNCY